MNHPRVYGVLLCFVCLQSFAWSGQQYFFRQCAEKTGVGSSPISAMTEDGRGFIWIATDRGLFRFDGREAVLFGGLDGHVLTLASDGDHTIFAGGDRGICCISLSPHCRDEIDSSFVRRLTAVTGPVRFLHVRGDGVLLIAAGNGNWSLTLPGRRLIRIADDDPAISTYNMVGHPALPSGIVVRSSVTDDAGREWIATNRGLYCVSAGGIEVFDAQNGLPSGDVRAILRDREGGILCGTAAGVFRLQPGRAIQYPLTGEGVVRHIVETDDGAVWLSTSTGLQCIKNGNISQLASRGLNRPMSIRCALPLGMERYFLATDNGLVYAVYGNDVILGPQNGLPDSTILQILAAKRGGYWIATGRGLAHWDGIHISRLTIRDGLPSDRITQIAEDKYGDLWIGTENGVGLLSKLGGNRIRLVQPMLGVHILSVFIDRSNRPWFGTLGDGVYGLSESGLCRISTEDGLASNTVQFISQDRFGTLYFGTPSGVTGLPESNLQRFLPAVPDRGSSSLSSASFIPFLRTTSLFTLTSQSGLLGTDMQQRAVMRDSAGRMWFGSSLGVTVYEPNDIPIPGHWSPDGHRDGKSIHRIFLTHLQIGNTPVACRDTLILRRDEHVFQARLTLPSLRDPSAVRYCYRLEGFEYTWHACSDGRVQYSGLAPGTYSLEVQATVGEGVWTRRSSVLTIVIPEPFTESPLFKVLVLVAVALAGYGFGMRNLRKRQAYAIVKTNVCASSADRASSDN